jgi:hypothetical protein
MLTAKSTGNLASLEAATALVSPWLIVLNNASSEVDVERTAVMVALRFLSASKVLASVTELAMFTLTSLPEMPNPKAAIEVPMLSDANLNSPIIFDTEAALVNVSVTVLIRDKFNVFGERAVMMFPLAVLKYPMKPATLGIADMDATTALL